MERAGHKAEHKISLHFERKAKVLIYIKDNVVLTGL